MLSVKFVVFLFSISLIAPVLAAGSPTPTTVPHGIQPAIETNSTVPPQSWLVRYPGLESGEINPNDLYKLKLLELAFAEMNQPLKLQPVNSSWVLESRSSRNLIDGRYDVHWLMTNQRHESMLRPIRVPIYKGLIGWRLLFIHTRNQAHFAAIETTAGLQKMVAGQGHDWPDAEILDKNNFALELSSYSRGLFKMLDVGRIDYFPRSLVEVWNEQQQFSESDLVVENHLALHYPAAYYFFVAKDNQALADIIEQGLLKAINNGSFDEIFYDRFGSDIRRAKLHERKVLKLTNPLLSEQTPLANNQLWLNINDLQTLNPSTAN
ncbi:substrate-binding periplasmic protein [Teredinibacter waterburyi]|jgi:ABC-type amino acid transport/signal transduction systems, periplasmic component/domain|uniref:substrate-binding periplasmic protein n=1 Tax=Teredinibacter waterburyi TaxID=1500538 RepID=UPI00165F5345|nr:diguanylate cyclase [Teredinibacter waterburyi]